MKKKRKNNEAFLEMEKTERNTKTHKQQYANFNMRKLKNEKIR